jgi:hypothetical protein
MTYLPHGSSAGFADGISSVVKFDEPKGLAFDANGNLLVADYN